jgi:hypothetical protein
MVEKGSGFRIKSGMEIFIAPKIYFYPTSGCFVPKGYWEDRDSSMTTDIFILQAATGRNGGLFRI